MLVNSRVHSPRPGTGFAGVVAAVVVAAGLAGLIPGVRADVPQESSPDRALADALARIEGAPLTLERALIEAADGSTDARGARAALTAARAAVRRERGAFDPELFGEWKRLSADTPTASLFAGADVLQTDETSGVLGARWRTRWGTELTGSLNSVRRETNNAFASLNPEYDATGRLELRQPLLRGSGPAARAALNVSERELAAAVARHDDALLGVRAAVESAYWELYAATRDYAVQLLIRDRAQSVLTETRLREQAGLVGPGQTASARVFVAEQEQALLDREELLDAASDRVATLLGRRPEGTARRFLAVDEPPSGFAAPDEELLVEAARRGNLELAAAAQSVAALRARAQAAARDVLPQVDLFGSLGGSGLAGAGRQVVIPFGDPPETLQTVTTGGRGESVSQVLDRKYPDWTVGVSFSLPLGGRRDRGAREVWRAEVARAEQGLEARRRALEEQVRSACRELAHGRRRLEVAGEGVAASQEQVRIGVLEFRAGRTTAFELARLGADLASAQQRYSQALVRAARAAAQLRRLTANAYPGKETVQ
jgi:outer membrane protein TolC